MKFYSVLLFLLGTLSQVGQPVVAQARLQPLLEIWNDETQADTTRLWAVDSIALIVYQNQPDSALFYANLQLQFAQSVNNKRWMAIGEQNIGTAYYFQGDLTNALDHYKGSLVWMEEVGNKKGMAGMLINIGIQYGGQGDFVQSQEYTLKALKIAEEIGDLEFQANALGRLGTLNYQSGNTEEAKEYFLRAYQTNEESGENKGLLASSLVNLGIFFAQEGEYDEAIPYTLRAAEIFKELDGKYGLADAYGNLGYIYGNTGDEEKELEYYLLALEIQREIGNQHGEAYQLFLIGQTYTERQDYPQAIAYFSQSQVLFQRVGDKTSLKEAAKELYLAYKASDQYESALEMHESWVTMRDSLNQEEQSKELLKQQFQFEQDKKDVLAKEELARQSLQRNALLIGLGLVGILAFVLFQNGRRRLKTNELLSTQKAEIEVKSNQNELLLKEIHHRVKNNLQSISSLLYLQSAHIQDPEMREAVAAGQHRVEAMALIHQKLYQRDNLAGIEMKDYLFNLVQSLIHTFDADPERISFTLDMPELELDVDTAVPLGLIVNELITNSLKYAFPDNRLGEITVSLRQNDKILELIVRDNGVGSANVKEGTSFGSKLVGLLTAQLGGKIEVDTEEGYQTRVWI